GIERLPQRRELVLDARLLPRPRAGARPRDRFVEFAVAGAAIAMPPRRSPEPRRRVAREHVQPRAHAAARAELRQAPPQILAHLREHVGRIRLAAEVVDQEPVDLVAVRLERARRGLFKRAYGHQLPELRLD